MKLFNFLSSKPKYRIFTLPKDLFQNSDYYGQVWSDCVQELNLSQEQARITLRLCDIFQNSIDNHTKFFITESYQERDGDVSGSTYEKILFHWFAMMFILSKKLNHKIFHALSLIFSETFYLHGREFESPNAFDNKIELHKDFYTKIIELFFNPRENEIEVYKDLYIAMMVKPLKSHLTGDLYIDFVELAPDVLIFTKYIAEDLKSFMKKLSKLDI